MRHQILMTRSLVIFDDFVILSKVLKLLSSNRIIQCSDNTLNTSDLSKLHTYSMILKSSELLGHESTGMFFDERNFVMYLTR